MIADHERDKVANQVERDFVPRVSCLTESALRKTVMVTGGLTVRADNMRRNLDISGGLLLSEAVMMKLGETIGRNTAHDIVYDAAMTAFEQGKVFRDLLLDDPRVAEVMSADELDALLDPARYTGLSAHLVDAILSGKG